MTDSRVLYLVACAAPPAPPAQRVRTGIEKAQAAGWDVCLVTEAIGLHLPLVALPYLNQAQAAHPALARSAEFLPANGVTILLGDGNVLVVGLSPLAAHDRLVPRDR